MSSFLDSDPTFIGRVAVGCWVWTGARNSAGYGVVRYNGKNWLAHRRSWTVANGEIPDGMWVLHRCDNPSCVRPDHLFLGNAADNVADMIAKKRERPPRGEAHAYRRDSSRCVRGERNGKSKLTANAVREIRAALARGEDPLEIAKRHGVKRVTVYGVKSGRVWSHVV